SEAWYRSIVEGAAAGIATSDVEGNITSVNEAFARMLGYRREELLGKNMLSLLHRDDRNVMLERYRQYLAGQATDLRLEVRGQHKDGGTVWIDTEPVPVFEGGRLTGFAAVVQDVTARHRAQEALRISAERLRGILGNASDAIVTFDSEGRIVSWNRAAERIFGYSADEVVGKDFTAIVVAKRSNVEAHRARLQAAVARGYLSEIGKRTV
ncbi:MAG: PAS domain S-box protein, partial [Dehalococcoidia bacterium]|nr:PAS domain S-box protein [Dehalococcoidia bacterium]